MSKADEFFRKCNFSKVQVIDKFTGEEYPYCDEYVRWDGTWEQHIHFNNSTRLMAASCELFGKATFFMNFTPDLLKAIHQYEKEKGWLEERRIQND